MELILKTGRKVVSDGDLNEVSVWDILGNVSGRRYKQSIELLFMREILNGIKKIVLFSKSKNKAVDEIAKFYNVNYRKLFLSLYEYGVLAIDKKNKEYVIEKKPRVQKKNEEYFLQNYSFTVSDELALCGSSLKVLLRSYIDDIAEILQRDAQVSKNLGLLGIVCKNKDEIISPKELLRVEKKLNSRGGDFFGIIASGQSLQYLKIDLPLEELDLAGRVISKIQVACSIAGVPYILINAGASVTYENQAEARAKFYDTTIKAIAETFLESGRDIVRKDKKILVPSTDLDYIIENERNIETK